VLGVEVSVAGAVFANAMRLPVATTPSTTTASAAPMVFCDGHVSNFRTKELFNYSDDSVVSLWNKDGLPHR